MARRDRTPDELINEISASATARHTALLADPPTDGSAGPARMFTGVTVDVGDAAAQPPARRVDARAGRPPRGRPPRRDGLAAPRAHVETYLAESLGVVLAKRVGAAPGTTAVLAVDGSAPAGVRRHRRRAAASGCRRSRSDPTVRLRDGPRDVRPARRRPPRARPGRGPRRRRPTRSASGCSPGSWSPGEPARRPPPPDVAWRLEDIPDQAGRTALVTGTTVGGLGHHTALELARRGARVVLAGRSDGPPRRDVRRRPPRGPRRRAGAAGRSTWPTSASYAAPPPAAAVARPARRAGQQRRRDGARRYQRTGDGLELQMATNHFGPFLLTGLLLPQLVAGEAGRGRHGLLADAPGRPLAPRSATRGTPPRPLPPLAGVRAAPSWPTCSSPTSSTAGPAGPGCRSTRWPRTPGFAGTHLAANGRYGRASGGRASILDAAVRARPRSAGRGRLADADGGHRRPARLDVLRPERLGGAARPARASSTSSRLAHDEAAQRRLWELSERDHRASATPEPGRGRAPGPARPTRGDVRRAVAGQHTARRRGRPQAAPRPVRTEKTVRPVRDVERGEVPRVGAPPAVPLGVRRRAARWPARAVGPAAGATASEVHAHEHSPSRDVHAGHAGLGDPAQQGAERPAVAVVVLDDARRCRPRPGRSRWRPRRPRRRPARRPGRRPSGAATRRASAGRRCR